MADVEKQEVEELTKQPTLYEQFTQPTCCVLWFGLTLATLIICSTVLATGNSETCTVDEEGLTFEARMEELLLDSKQEAWQALRTMVNDAFPSEVPTTTDIPEPQPFSSTVWNENKHFQLPDNVYDAWFYPEQGTFYGVVMGDPENGGSEEYHIIGSYESDDAYVLIGELDYALAGSYGFASGTTGTSTTHPFTTTPRHVAAFLVAKDFSQFSLARVYYGLRMIGEVDTWIESYQVYLDWQIQPTEGYLPGWGDFKLSNTVAGYFQTFTQECGLTEDAADYVADLVNRGIVRGTHCASVFAA